MVFGLKKQSSMRGFFKWRKPLEAKKDELPELTEDGTGTDDTFEKDLSGVEDSFEAPENVSKPKKEFKRGTEAYTAALEVKIRKLEMQKKNTQTKVQRFVQEKQATLKSLKAQLEHAQDSLNGSKAYQTTLERKLRKVEQQAKEDRAKLQAYAALVEKIRQQSMRVEADDDDSTLEGPAPASPPRGNDINNLINEFLSNSTPTSPGNYTAPTLNMSSSDEEVAKLFDFDIEDEEGQEVHYDDPEDGQDDDSDDNSTISELTSGSMFSKKMRMRSGIRLGRTRSHSRRRSRSVTKSKKEPKKSSGKASMLITEDRLEL